MNCIRSIVNRPGAVLSLGNDAQFFNELPVVHGANGQFAVADLHPVAMDATDFVQVNNVTPMNPAEIIFR